MCFNVLIVSKKIGVNCIFPHISNQMFGFSRKYIGHYLKIKNRNPKTDPNDWGKARGWVKDRALTFFDFPLAKCSRKIILFYSRCNYRAYFFLK